MTSKTTEMTLTPTSSDATPAPAIGYEGVRFNALRHGILSRYVVLSHENGEDYQSLIGALFQEHMKYRYYEDGTLRLSCVFKRQLTWLPHCAPAVCR